METSFAAFQQMMFSFGADLFLIENLTSEVRPEFGEQPSRPPE
jgi:hypothetical protein